MLASLVLLHVAACGDSEKTESAGNAITETESDPPQLIPRRALGPNVNTSKTELLPLASADGNTLYFSRANYLAPDVDAVLQAEFDTIAQPSREACTESRLLVAEAEDEADRERLRDYANAVCAEADVKADALAGIRRILGTQTNLSANVYRTERLDDGSWGVAVRMPAPFRMEFWNLVGQNTEDVWLSSALPDRNTLLLSGRGVHQIDGSVLLECGAAVQAISEADRTECPRHMIMQISRDEKACWTGETGQDGLPVTVPLAEDYERRDGNCLGAIAVHRTKDGWQRGKPIVTYSGEGVRPRVETAAIAASGSVIVFSARRNLRDDPARPGQAQMDLYVTERNDDGIWSTPRLLEGLNTTSHEQHPFIAADEKTLYFASDRPGGEGGFDIWLARRSGESWASWSAPENLGPAINTEEDETSISVDASGRYAFMSAGIGQQQDIYEFGLPPGMRPAPVVLIEGRVLWLAANALPEDPNQPGGPSTGGGVPLDLAGIDLPVGSGSLRYKEQSGSSGGQGGGLSGGAGLNPGNGRFQMALPVGGSYTVYFEGMAGVGVSQTIDLRGMTSGGTMQLDLTIAPLCSGTVLPLNSVFFEVDKSALLPESEIELRRFAEILGSYPSMIVEIAGHTDSTNTDEYNQALSEARALAVHEWLAANGADAGRLSQQGYGEMVPVASNDTEEGRRKNRRVEFRILQMSDSACRL